MLRRMKRMRRSSELSLSALTPARLRELAGNKIFARGEDYFAEGRVEEMKERAGKLVAQVLGSEPYSVELWQRGAQLEYACSCPYGEEGEFCKHCVAVGLALLAGQRPSGGSRVGVHREIGLDDIRRVLEKETKESLLDLLLARAAEDEALLDLLRLRAARHQTRGRVDVEAFKAVLRRTIMPSEFLDWREAGRHAAGIERVIGSLEELITKESAAEAMELIEYALKQVEQAMNEVDDSDGDMGAVLERLQDLHHRACKKARPDAIELARRLFDWELSSPWEVFHGAVARYADVLGKKGVAEYRRLAEACWAKVPFLGPNQQSADQYRGRFRITSILQALARQAGDLDAEVEVLGRDLSSAYRFLEIATLYRQAGRFDEALAWAEKGVSAFPVRTDRRLREFLAEEYHRKERHDEALALAWAAFSEQPSEPEYKRLKEHADHTGSWPRWREKALGSIRERIEKLRSSTPKTAWGPSIDHSLLVEIFLFERDPEAAWKEALLGGCSRMLWLALAERRERAHPEESLAIYKRELESTLTQANQAAYETGVRLLKKIHGVLSRTGQKERFHLYLASVSAAHARKRNFVRLLEETRWA